MGQVALRLIKIGNEGRIRLVRNLRGMQSSMTGAEEPELLKESEIEEYSQSNSNTQQWRNIKSRKSYRSIMLARKVLVCSMATSSVRLPSLATKQSLQLSLCLKGYLLGNTCSNYMF